jgi:transcriptional regulator with XRE-family HTH domain
VNIKPEILADLDRFLSEELEIEDHDLYEEAELSEDIKYYSAPQAPAPAPEEHAGNAVFNSIDDVFGSLGETFQEKLLKIIDEKGLTDAQVYTKANIDRRLFSKIRCNVNYKPSKSTALALAIALGLDLDETTDLLGRAGLALSPSSKADLIVKYCIINRIYDILDVNALLYEYDQQLLGY